MDEQTEHPDLQDPERPEHIKALRRRGSLTIWFDPDMVRAAKPTGKRGRRSVCSDAALRACLTMKVLFGMALLQTTGFVESLIGLDRMCRISAP